MMHTNIFLFIVSTLLVAQATAYDCDYGKPATGPNCTLECDKPMTCIFITPSPDEADDGMKLMGRWECKCLPPYVDRDGGCLLDCNQDEYYEDFMCKKHCQAGEIKSSNGTCKKLSLLGQACDNRYECKAAYSDCVNETCQCLDGFEPIGSSTCQGQVSCPLGEPLRKSFGLLQCGFWLESSNKEMRCPSGYTCFYGSYDEQRQASRVDKQMSVKGHCCPSTYESRKCPVGQPHPNATCIRGIKSDCPESTHFCFDASGKLNLEREHCCPKPCGDRQHFVNGHCYKWKNLGEKCELNEECPSFWEMVCKEGRCACADGWRLVNSTYYSKEGKITQQCTKICGEGEREIFIGYCRKSRKLGEECDPKSTEERCDSSFSYCSSKTKTCTCDCGQVQLDEWHCGQEPTCPYNVTSLNHEANTTWTFCRIPKTKNMKRTMVETCPSGQYCATYRHSDFYYGEHAGICCPRPEKALCPDNSIGTVKCDPSKPDVCGQNGKCHKYLNSMAAPADQTDGHVCCYGK